ncbi:MAG: hypothetical protein EOP14_05850, partial [Pseudomonas sp.]
MASLATITVDTTPATLVNVTSSKANGSYKAGTTITILAQFSKNVYVTNGGDIKLLLENGSTDHYALYTGGTGTDTLSFDYVVQAGDTSADLDYESTSALTVTPSGAIKDSAGSNSTLTLPAIGGPASISGQKVIVIDTTAPAAPVITAPADGAYSTNNLTVVSGTSEANASIEIKSGSTTVGTGTASGTNWTVTLTSPLSDGVYSLTAIATDAAGNVGSASLANDVTVDTSAPLAPVISAFTTPTLDPTPALSGTSEANMIIKVYASATLVATTTANASGNWSVTTSSLSDATYSMTATATDPGARTSPASAALSLNIDTTNPTAPSAVAFSSSYSTTSSLGVTWTNSTDINFTTHNLKLCSSNLCSVGCTSASTATASPSTLTGVDGVPYYACVQGVDSLNHVSAWVASASTATVDTTAPNITDVTSSTANGYYPAASVIAVTVTFSEIVNVVTPGALGLKLETGPTDRTAVYASGSGSTVLTFNYTVQATDLSPDLDYFDTNSLTVGAGSIKDPAGNSAVLDLPALGGGHSIATQKAIVIDTTVPSNPSSVGFSGTVTNSLSFNMGWTASSDTNFSTHNTKICTNIDCATGCTSISTSVTSPKSMTGVNGATYYGCVQGLDLAGQMSAFVNSTGTIRVDTTP